MLSLRSLQPGRIHGSFFYTDITGFLLLYWYPRQLQADIPGLPPALLKPSKKYTMHTMEKCLTNTKSKWDLRSGKHSRTGFIMNRML